MNYGMNNNLGKANNVNRTQNSANVNKNFINYLLREIKKIKWPKYNNRVTVVTPLKFFIIVVSRGGIEPRGETATFFLSKKN